MLYEAAEIFSIWFHVPRIINSWAHNIQKLIFKMNPSVKMNNSTKNMKNLLNDYFNHRYKMEYIIYFWGYLYFNLPIDYKFFAAKKFSMKHSFVNWEKQSVDDVDRHYRALANMVIFYQYYSSVLLVSTIIFYICYEVKSYMIQLGKRKNWHE